MVARPIWIPVTAISMISAHRNGRHDLIIASGTLFLLSYKSTVRKRLFGATVSGRQPWLDDDGFENSGCGCMMWILEVASCKDAKTQRQKTSLVAEVEFRKTTHDCVPRGERTNKLMWVMLPNNK